MRTPTGTCAAWARAAACRCTSRCWSSSLALLPIIPDAAWKPGGTEDPAWRILLLLAATIGLPYFLLATTSPLVQAWFARRFEGRSPYRLFALSNLASLLALVGYPFLLEPWIPTRTQALGWSVGYGIFAALCVAAAFAGARAPVALRAPQAGRAASAGDTPPAVARQLAVVRARRHGLAAAPRRVQPHHAEHRGRPAAVDRAAHDLPVDVHPVLRSVAAGIAATLFLSMAAAALGVMAWTLADTRLTHELGIQLPVFCVGLFIACMFCHGELARSKPAPRHLTRFYLMIALGRCARRGLRRHRRAAGAAGLLRARPRPRPVRAAAALAGSPRRRGIRDAGRRLHGGHRRAARLGPAASSTMRRS